VCGYDIEVLDFNVDETSIPKSSINIGRGKVPDVQSIQVHFQRRWDCTLQMAASREVGNGALTGVADSRSSHAISDYAEAVVEVMQRINHDSAATHQP
jgi:hypothetical protein